MSVFDRLTIACSWVSRFNQNLKSKLTQIGLSHFIDQHIVCDIPCVATSNMLLSYTVKI